MSEQVCGTCGTPENFPEDSKSELRPYGPGGEMICFRCAFATPEAEQRTEQNFTTIVEATHATGLPFVIGDLPSPAQHAATEGESA